MTTILNRWRCKNIDGEVIAMVNDEKRFSRIAMTVPGCTLIAYQLHMPDSQESTAYRMCITDLCAIGFDISNKRENLFRCFFPGFEEFLKGARLQ